MIHLPFIMSFVLAGGTLAKLVLAHDSKSLDPHYLTHHYEERSEDHISEGQRWFYCAGLGIALFCTGEFCHLSLYLSPQSNTSTPALIPTQKQ